MKERSIKHATFTIERTYEASPARVFRAFSDPAVKSRWFAGPEGWTEEAGEFDFRIGGRETSGGGPVGGPVHRFNAVYHDIVPNERIIYSYDMRLDEARISVSLATIELKPSGKGTQLTLTELGAYLDGYDDSNLREEGTRGLLDALGAVLERESISA